MTANLGTRMLKRHEKGERIVKGWARVLTLSIAAACLSVFVMAPKKETPATVKKTKEEKPQKVKEEKLQGEKAGPKQVVHVVCFKFNEGVSQEQIDKVCKDFSALRKKVPSIVNYRAGTNNSPEGLNKGFTHCFIVTFANVKGRDAYLPHPAHQEFVKTLDGLIADVFVIDFEAE